MSARPPNDEQSRLWNGTAGRAWVDLQVVLDRLFEPVGGAVVGDGFPGAGRRVLDVGCGAGATTLATASRLGPDGRCLGVDLSAALIDLAASRARAANLRAADLLRADAQTHAFAPASFDAAISRFGVMFFDDAVAALANVRRAVRPGGRLAFASWRSPAENPFMTAAPRAAAPLLPPAPAPDPHAPGQFAFADPERVHRILAEAGWQDVRIRSLDVPASLSEADLRLFATRVGPVGNVLPTLAPDLRERIGEALHAAYDPFRDEGGVRFGLALWQVTARA